LFIKRAIQRRQPQRHSTGSICHIPITRLTRTWQTTRFTNIEIPKNSHYDEW
jgi:hypothetical protein